MPEVKRRNRAKTGKRSDEAYTQMTVLVPESLRRELKSRAALEGTDMSSIVEKVLREYLSRPSEGAPHGSHS